MPGIFELKKNDSDQFSFSLTAESGETILRSELYETKPSAQNGIASVQKNSPSDERYERKVATDGRFYFTLKAANHQVIGTSPMYKSADGRDASIASVKANGATATVKDST
jgi:uncharacterized protein YegP (UPF0339 family)